MIAGLPSKTTRPGRLVGPRVLALWVPAGLFGLVALAVARAQGLPSALQWQLGGLLLLPALAGVLLAARRAREAERDLSRIAASLQSAALDELASVRPTTPEGETITRAVTVLVRQSGRAARAEEAARDRVETAQHLRVNFVASMGHDLRAPLNSMLGFADLLLLEDEEALSRVQRDSLSRIRQRTLDLLTLIDDMLDWARLQAGRLTLARTPVPLIQVVQGAIDRATSRAAGRPFSVELSALPEGAVVHVDQTHLQHALVAVMGDAIRGGHGQPLQLSAQLERTSAGGSQRLQIVVRDPALLVREEDQQRLLEAFRPSYAPSGKRIAGIGLGLACARALVRAHGGELTCLSDARSGTEFRLTLDA